MTERLARASSRRPWLVVGLWLLVILAALLLVAMFLAFEGEAEITRTTESKQAEQIIADGFRQEAASGEAISEVVVVRAEGGDVRTEATRAHVAALAEQLRGAGAERVVTYAEEQGLVSQDGDSTVLLLALGRDGEDDVEDVVDVVERLDEEPRYTAAVTGERTADADEDAASLEDLKKGELLFGAPLALVVLLLVFGAVVAGLVPLLLAIASIVVALALVALLAQAYDLSVFTQNMLIGMGLALGIDYSLFTLSRYREERQQGREKLDAIATSGATAGRAVLFSGIAFVLAMVGLLLVPSTIFRSLAAGAILVGIVSVIAALTLLPAVLALLGDRVNALRIPFFGRSAEQRGPRGRLLGRDRPPDHAPPRAQSLAWRRFPSHARRSRARARHRHLGRCDPPGPLRVEAGLSPASRGVSEAVDRAGRDRGRRRYPRVGRGRGTGRARARARAPPHLRGGDRRGERGRHRGSRHDSDRGQS